MVANRTKQQSCEVFKALAGPADHRIGGLRDPAAVTGSTAPFATDDLTLHRPIQLFLSLSLTSLSSLAFDELDGILKSVTAISAESGAWR